MKHFLKNSWPQLENWLLENPEKSSHWLERQVRTAARILFAVLRDLVNGQLTLHAMSLVYTTLLSLVPLLALSFSVLKYFNVQDQFTPMLYGFFEPMGEKGLEIHNNILSFVDNVKVGVLGTLGFVVLLYTVISLVQKIERAFNGIWYVPQLRSLSRRISNYLSAILVGPALIVTAISVTASTMNSEFVLSLLAIEPFGSLVLLLTRLMPYLMIIAAFTFFYVLMPGTRVQVGSALYGGVVAGISWQASSLLFTAFVVGSAKYDAIYSGFAVGILLLIWLYVNWLILLMGSSIAFYHQHGNQITRKIDAEAAPELLEKLGLELMVHVAKRYESNDQPLSQDEIEKLNFIPSMITRRIVDKLVAHQLLLVVGQKSDRLAPGRSTDQITVADIFQALRQDDERLLQSLENSPAVDQLIQSTAEERNSKLARVSLRNLIADE